MYRQPYAASVPEAKLGMVVGSETIRMTYLRVMMSNLVYFRKRHEKFNCSIFTVRIRGLDKAALDMANEAVSAGDNGEGEGGAPAKLAPMVDLGKVVFKGEKFFWRCARNVKQ